ncbi:MAG: DUF2064 domain-containing protein [Cyclobacteriaceae bacterium]
MINEEKIALIYFSRHATSEGRSKAWFSSALTEKNSSLASSLITQSTKVLRQAGFPVFHYHEDNQQGITFGERIANACQEVFALGYEAVITVGNDCPEMGNTNWHEIRQQLISGKCVIGPSLRGGAYLIGMTKKVFDKEHFQKLPWQTSRLFTALLEFCELPHESPCLLVSLRDINTLHDVKKLLKSEILDGNLKRTLLRLLFQKSKHAAPQSGYLPTFPVLSDSPFRAPPALLFSCVSW